MDEVDICKIYYQSGLTHEDRIWIEEQLSYCDIKIPPYDLSWLKHDRDKFLNKNPYLTTNECRTMYLE